MEVINLDPDVKAQLTKLVSVRLCSPVHGQILMDLVVNHPEPDEPSYATFMKVSEAEGEEEEAPPPPASVARPVQTRGALRVGPSLSRDTAACGAIIFN